MRSPEAARALPGLVAAGVLEPARAAPLLTAARGEIVSVRAELRALLGAGVALLAAGAGLLVAEVRTALDPVAVAVVLALAFAGALAAVLRRAPPFCWAAPAREADWIVDGLVLLAASLLGAELGWIEWRFTPLGAAWPWHLLLVALATGALAVRFDSIPGWTLALSTFAAWRGVAISSTPGQLLEALLGGREERVRANLLLCAALFALLAAAAARSGRKPHFEPATTLLAALASGFAFASGLGRADLWPLFALALGALGAGVARFAFARRRLGLFALGALALYLAATRTLLELGGGPALGCLWLTASTVGAIVLLARVHRRFRAEEARERAAASTSPPAAGLPDPPPAAEGTPR
jgi:hypothetical protein